MESTNFDKMTKYEKIYCELLLAKYRTPPKFEEVIPELVEWWDVDRCTEWQNMLTVYNEKKEEYTKTLEAEFRKDPYKLVDYLVPSIFRFCRNYKVPCTPTLVASLIDNAMHTGAGAISESCIRSQYYNYAIKKYPGDTLEEVRFEYPFDVLDRVRYTDIIVSQWAHMEVHDQRNKTMPYILTNLMALRQEVPKNITPYYQILIDMADYNNNLYTNVAKDITAMLYSVETRTVYDPIEPMLLGECDFTEYFTTKMKALGKRTIKKFVEQENANTEIDLDCEQLVSVLWHVRINEGPKLATTCNLSKRRAAMVRQPTIFEKYINRLDKDQLREICDFFDVKYNDLTDKEILVVYTTEIFSNVEIPVKADPFDRLHESLSDLKDGQGAILTNLSQIESLIVTNCDTTDDIWRVVCENHKSIELKLDTENETLFANRVNKKLSEVLLAYKTLASGKFQGAETMIVNLIGEALKLVKLEWVSKLFKKYKSEKSCSNASRISDTVSINKIDEIATEVARKLTTRYRAQLSHVRTSDCADVGEHAVFRMVKYMDKNFNDDVDLVDQLIQSVYKVTLADKRVISSKKINDKGWTVDGMFSRIWMNTGDKTYKNIDRPDNKYGYINVEGSEPGAFRLMELARQLV